MDNLVRLALLGSRKAQEEITNRGEFLPCWCCGSDEVNFVNDRGFQIKCQKCKSTGKAGSLLNAMKNWNTRPSVLPSLVLCKDCKYRCNCSNYIGETGVFGDYDFCSKGEREDEYDPDVQWCLSELRDILEIMGDMSSDRQRELVQADLRRTQ